MSQDSSSRGYPSKPSLKHLFILILFLYLPMIALPLYAEEIGSGAKVYDFRLDPRESCRTWEMRFDLTDEEIHAGRFLTARDVFTSDSLAIVREELSPTRYSITLNLTRGYFATGNGRLYIELEKGTPTESDPLPAPTDLRLATGTRCFRFSCAHQAEYVALTIFKRSMGAPVWERLLSENSPWEISLEPLVVGGHYLLMASQCGPDARYSKPGLLGFRIEAVQERCRTCGGTGWLGAHPVSKEYSEVCPYCRGTGVRLFPYPVPEPALPEGIDE